MKCPNCKSIIAEDSNYCEICGTRVLRFCKDNRRKQNPEVKRFFWYAVAAVVVGVLIIFLANYINNKEEKNGQGQSLCFNEILINNIDNLIDEYGRHVPWVEIFNPSHKSVNLADCYLTDDTTGYAAEKKQGGAVPEHWYRIPKTDIKTNMPQRSYLVFYLDGYPLHGTFHVNFDPRTSRTNYIALISANGREIIDFMYYPKEVLMEKELSYGLFEDGNADSVGLLNQYTPGASNAP